jgi:L-asparaginase/Glu-tRNA(Gln) amidotransferase subunit D
MFHFRRFFLALFVAVPVVATGSVAWAEQIVVGAASNLGGFAVLVAQEKGYFAKNGVDVKVEIRNTGSELSKGQRCRRVPVRTGRVLQHPGSAGARPERSRRRRL